ncbi:methylenetetrahydrofolate reductase [NAD(P)H] [Anatilimnocola floriformis]|uniref:methylenetetrahydrofolate reductase [NAD(P)H] n=1 Tax=Anatilimnocola floriformis TaxID=2948575 RepID=UPI0020C4D10C|nr:methylenetetrahydrofolate reductase [NAD(P)H] [Anatilimnocola floriformis]
MTFYPAKNFTLSFELFPPKTAAAEAAMYENVEHLMAFGPDVITCTYGAGGSTQKKTLEITSEVKRRFGVRVASHLTCVGSTVDQLREYLKEASGRGVDNIVALRGDPPKGQETFKPVDGGLRYANELLALVKGEFPSYGVAVAGYPETHQEAPSFEVDLQNLQRKVAAGADCIITQLFYDNADFFRFRDACTALGIRVPIIPGILPVTNLGQIQRITSLCKARLPEAFIAKLSEKDDADWQFQVGVEFATQQVQELIDRGIPGVHFYVLNKSPATSAVLKAVRV